MRAKEAIQQTRQKQQITGIGDIATSHIPIHREHRTLLVGIVGGLEKAIALHIKYIVHIDLSGHRLPIHMHQ